VEIQLAQLVELLEILIVKDGAEPAGKLPESHLPGLVEATLGDKAADKIRLAQPNDPVTLLLRGRFAG
jgi:hypothetical protein